MKFRSGASLDTSQVSDRRGMGAGGLTLGGGGLIGIIFLVVQLLNGGSLPAIDITNPGAGAGAENQPDLASECRTGVDANQRTDCLVVGVVNSVQSFWSKTLRNYRPAETVFFDGAVNTGCGAATSATGPFYCSADQNVYIDLGFYDELRTKFGAQGGPFAQAYVITHEYGHHVQDLTGTLQASRGDASGAQGGSVRVELQADCYAGLWAANAVETGYIEELTEGDIADGLNAAASIGDDRIQEQFQGEVHPESFTHGTSEQRQRWFLRGYKGTSMDDCDTFSARTV